MEKVKLDNLKLAQEIMPILFDLQNRNTEVEIAYRDIVNIIHETVIIFCKKNIKVSD